MELSLRSNGNNIHLFSFFSGIGLLDLGFEKEDFKIVYVNESHEPFLNAYKYSRKKYFFSWAEIPGNDNVKLIEFLKQNFCIDWLKIARIEKIDNNTVIRFSNEKNTLSIRINNEKTKAILTIDDVETDQFIAEKENDKLNIYIIQSPKYGYFLGKIEGLLENEKKIELTNNISISRNEGNIVGFIGGPPCPDFSVGGKNNGKHGERGKLSLTYVNLINQHQPDFFLFENVKGLWRTKKHREYYEELKKLLQNSGFIISEQLINAIEYGVPQDRERIILFGVNENFIQKIGLAFDKSKKIILDGAFPWKKYAKYPGETAFQYTWPQNSAFEEDSILDRPNNIPIELTVEYWFEKNDVSNHPNSLHYFKPRAGLNRFLTVDEGDDSKKSFKRLHRWRYSPTTAYGNNEVHLNPYKARRLSVSEVLAIQSLPKEFELPGDMSLSNMFKAMGNGVPFLAAKMIARTIKDIITVEEK